MTLIDNSVLAARDSLLESLSLFRARSLMCAGVAIFLCGFVSASSPAVGAPAGAEAVPPSAQVSEDVIIRAPDVVRRPLPGSGPGAPPGLTNPEIISLTGAASYSDLDLSKASDVQELQRRIGNTARFICQELTRRYPRQNGEYVYSANDCVKKATDDGLETLRQLTAR
jgi:UrcA family protein